MPLPTGTTSGSGLSRSEAAIQAWKKRQRAKPATPGGLSPKIAARVKEILAAKQKKGKPKVATGGKGRAKPKVDPAKEKEKAARLVERATAKQDRDKAKAERVTTQAAAKQEREKSKVERATAAQAKQQATLKKQKAAARSAKEKAKAGALGKQGKEQASAQAKVAKEQASAAAEKEKATKPAKEQAANRAKVAQEMAEQDLGLAPSGSQALSDFVDGKPLKPETAKEFEAMGLTEKDEAGNHRLTTEGRAAASAMSKGDTRAAIDAISRAGSKKQKATEPKAKKAIDMSDLAIKAGARHSRSDIQHLQSIHDSSVACGASCATEGDDSGMGELDDEDEGVKAVKAMYDDPIAYAMHECQDIGQACGALQMLCYLLQSELSESNEDEETVPGLVQSARLIVKYIGNELDMIEEGGDAIGTIGHEPMKAYEIPSPGMFARLDVRGDADALTFYNKFTGEWEALKAIAEREDVNPKAGVAEYGNVTFADTKNKKYPIDTADHVRAAWNYIAKAENAAKYDPDEVSQIKSKIVSAWKKLIDKAGPPSAGKAVDDAWLHIDGSAIKALDNDEIGGYAVLFGDAQNHDIERDYYTKATNFWLDDFGWPRPITYHHGMDAATRDNPVIGHWLKANVDDTGVWLTGQLDRAHAYYKAIKELAARGYLKLSSDSAPQWVQREKQPNGTNFVKRWPMITASCTVTPMEPRMLPVEVKAYLAEIGMDIDDSPEVIDPDAARLDEAKAADDERTRRLLFELELLEIEMETA